MTKTVETPKPADDSALPRGARAVPRSVWALGFVSMLMDISSEMVHALLPIYMVAVLGTSVLAVGLIEGIAEATASIVKVFSGAISDRFGKRKLLAVLGYGLGALTKPVFPLAGGLEWLVSARFVDRVGKGIRGAPRDALVADVTPPHLRGTAYGLRQTLDTIGAFTGPLLAIGLMWWTADNYQQVFWLAVLPAFAAVAVLVFFVKEPAAPVAPRPRQWPLCKRELLRLPSAYWMVVGLGLVFTLARFSEAFLILRAQSAGLPPMGACGARRDGHRLCAVRVSSGGAVGPPSPAGCAARGPGTVDWCRSGAGFCTGSFGSGAGRGAVGTAYGVQPGVAQRDGCRQRAR